MICDSTGQNEKYNVWLCKWEGGAYLCTHKESETHYLCSCACAVLTTACVSRRQAFPLARRSEIGRQEIKMLGRSHTTRFWAYDDQRCPPPTTPSPTCSVRPSAFFSVTILNNRRVSQSCATILYDDPSWHIASDLIRRTTEIV